MIESLATGITVVALVLALVAAVCAALDRLPPRAHLLALVVLQVVLVGQAVVVLTRLGSWGGPVGELLGYLAVSVVVLPGGMALVVEERSRWGTLVLAAACLTVSVVVFRTFVVWESGLGVGG